MARIAGVDLPNKHVNIALTYIYGIGRSAANHICELTKTDPNRLINDLSEDDPQPCTLCQSKYGF